MDRFHALRDLGREAFRAEFMTPPGVMNAIGMLCAFFIILALGTTELVQSLLGAVKSHYVAHSASPYIILGMYLGAILLCVVMLLTLGQPRNSRD